MAFLWPSFVGLWCPLNAYSDESILELLGHNRVTGSTVLFADFDEKLWDKLLVNKPQSVAINGCHVHSSRLDILPYYWRFRLDYCIVPSRWLSRLNRGRVWYNHMSLPAYQCRLVMISVFQQFLCRKSFVNNTPATHSSAIQSLRGVGVVVLAGDAGHGKDCSIPVFNIRNRVVILGQVAVSPDGLNPAVAKSNRWEPLVYRFG